MESNNSGKSNKMERRFGIFTALSMVIGIVIGSGVFIKGGKVLNLTGGNMMQGILVVAICGVICIICSLVFAELGAKYEKCNGIVDYAEAALGDKFAYYVGWFMTTIYTPAIATIVSFFAAMMFLQLFGINSVDFANGSINSATIALGAGFLMLGYAINMLSPIVAGKLQVGGTIIKLVPLILMGVVGTIVGFTKGTTQNVLDFVNTAAYTPVDAAGFFKAIVGFVFAFEGWIMATTINSELEEPKKNLPKALVLGSVITIVLYILYIFSMSSVGDVATITSTWPFGETLPKIAFSNIFGKAVGTLVYVFVTISCLGTMNGAIMTSCRGLYALSSRGMGPFPKFFGDVDDQNNFAIKSGLFGLITAGFWYAWTVMMWMGGPDFFGNVHGSVFLAWEPDEIGIICLYALYIPMMIGLMIKAKELSPFKRFVLPGLGILCCLFYCYAVWVGYGAKMVIGFIIFFAVVEFIGYLVKGKKK